MQYFVKGVLRHFETASLSVNISTNVHIFPCSSYELDLGQNSGRHILYGTGVWVADSLNQMLSTSFVLSDGSIVRFPFVGIEDNQLGTEDYDGPSQNSVLDVLPRNFHAHSIRMIGITGNLLESSSLGDNVIANIAFKYVCQYPYCQ